MKLAKLTKSKNFWVAVALFVAVLAVIVYVPKKIAGTKTEGPFVPPSVSVTRNPTPLTPTASPTLSQAHQDEVEWLKKQGKYFDWRDTVQAEAPPPPAAAPPSPQREVLYVSYERTTEEQMLREMFWGSYDGHRTSSGGMISVASIGSQHGQAESHAGRPSSISNLRYGCPVPGVVMRSTYATTKSDNFVMIRVNDPTNCAGLPPGSILVGSSRADYSVFRAATSIQSISLPTGESFPVGGIVLGADGAPGIGYQVTRNDRKMLGLGALFAGTSAGAEAARKDSSQVTAYDWGFEQSQNKSDNRLREGVLEGSSTMLKMMADGIVDEYRQVSPIVVTVPQGLPVEVVLMPRDGG